PAERRRDSRFVHDSDDWSVGFQGGSRAPRVLGSGKRRKPENPGTWNPGTWNLEPSPLRLTPAHPPPVLRKEFTVTCAMRHRVAPAQQVRHGATRCVMALVRGES